MSQVRADAEELAAFAQAAGGVDAIVANPMFASMKELNEAKKFAYSRYDAIGLFRMLELASATDPAALEKMATSSGLQLKKVIENLIPSTLNPTRTSLSLCWNYYRRQK